MDEDTEMSDTSAQEAATAGGSAELISNSNQQENGQAVSARGNICNNYPCFDNS